MFTSRVMVIKMENNGSFLHFLFDDSKKLVTTVHLKEIFLSKYDLDKWPHFLSTNEIYPGPILQSEGMHAIF